jgi:ERCC4-related helicase
LLSNDPSNSFNRSFFLLCLYPTRNVYDDINVLRSFFYLDIVQEGLDIPTCSYVIRYEFVSDEIGTIQSRGRARAQDSSYYLITERDSINHQREKNNKIRENEMEEAIDKWPTIDKDRFHDDVEKNTVSIYNILSILYKPLSS